MISPVFKLSPKTGNYLFHPVLYIAGAVIITVVLITFSKVNFLWMAIIPGAIAGLVFYMRKVWRALWEARRRSLWLEEDFVP
jgi:hypothetical protein